METTQLVALMAAILEAGDRAHKQADGDPRIDRPYEYARRAVDLVIAAEHIASDGIGYQGGGRGHWPDMTAGYHRQRTMEEQRAHVSAVED